MADNLTVASVTLRGKGNYSGEVTQNFNIKSVWWVWVGPTDGTWNTPANWNRLGSGIGDGYPTGTRTLPDTTKVYLNIAQFTAGTWRVNVTDNVTYISNLVDCAGSDLTLYTLNGKRVANWTYPTEINGILRLEGSARPFSAGDDFAYVQIKGEYHWKGMTAPGACSAVEFAADNALLTATGCTFAQTGTDTYKYKAFVNRGNHPARLALTNTTWKMHQEGLNVLGTSATATFSNSTMYAGIGANQFGGDFTLDDSTVALKNVASVTFPARAGFPESGQTISYGDTFVTTALRLKGAQTKLALSGSYVPTGTVAFEIPAGGFANENNSFSAIVDKSNTYFSLDVGVTGTAPIAVGGAVDLSGATLTVDASAIPASVMAGRSKRFPLVRAGTALTPPASANMSVTGTVSGYVSRIEVTEDTKGLDLVIYKAVIVKANNTTKVYGDADPELTATVSGLNPGDTVQYTVYRNPGEDVGKYLIVPRTENQYQGDYWLNLAGDAGGFTITPAELTATITSFPVSYGSAVPTYTATYATFKRGDESPTNIPTYACAYTTTSPVGTYPITFATAPLFKNYAVTATNEGTVTVSQASNAWTTEPSISPTTWVQGVGPTTVTSAVATFGTDTMTITCNGTAVAGDLQTYLQGLTVGSYEVVFTVPGTDNYTELSKTIAVTVTLDAFYGSVTAGANLDWANANNWFADAGRTQDKGRYPNSTLADVYLGKSDVSGTVTYKDGTAQLKHLTMEGDIQKCAFVTLQFPNDGAASSPIVENRKGQLVFQSATLTGVGTIRGEANTTNTFLAATTTAATIGIVNDTLTAGQTATVMFGSSSSGVRAEVGYLQTGSAGTTKVVIDNALARLTSTTAASGGAGKLAFDIKLGANNLPLTAANCPLDVAGTLSIASNSTLTVDATALTQSGTYPLITAGTLTGLGADQLLVEAKVKCAANREAVVWRTAGSNVVYLDILAPVCIYDFNAANPLRATLGTDAYIATNRFKLNSKGTEYIPDGGSIRVPGLATCLSETVGGEPGFKVQRYEHLCLPVPRQQLRGRHMKIFMRLRLKDQGTSNYASIFYWYPEVKDDGFMFVWSKPSNYGNYGGRMIKSTGNPESLFENGNHYQNPNPFTYDEWHDLEFLQTVNGSMLRKNGLVMISTANRNMTQEFTGNDDPTKGRTAGPHKRDFFGGFADYMLATDDVLRIGCDDSGEDDPIWLSQLVIYGIDGESVPTGVQKTAETAGGDYDWSTIATDNYQNEVIFAPTAAQIWTGSESASKLLRVRFNGGTATFNDLKLDYKAKIDHEIWTLENGSYVTLNDTTFTYDETDSETGVGYLDVCGSSALTVTGTFAGANRTGIRFPEVGSGAGSVAFVDATATTMAELIGGKAGVTQTLALTNAVVAFAKAATTNGVAGKLAIAIKLGANNTTDNTVMTFAGGLKINAGSTLKVDATGVTTPGVYPLVAAGEWLDASAETLVSSANVSVPSGWVYVVRTVDNRVELVLMSNVFTWIGEDGGSWTNQINWIREGAEAPSYGFPSSAQHIAKFTNGTYRVITEAVSNTTYKIKEILDDPGTNVRIVNKTYANTGVIGVEAKDPNYAGVITLESTESAWGWNQGEYDAKHYDLVWAYYASGVFLGYGVPKILNELHVLNHRYKYPAAASIGFGADNALMTFTGCSFNQGYWTGPAVSLCNTNDITWRTRLAITNTSWYSEFAAPNSLGTNAVVSIAQHSNIRMGMNADAFGGSFTIDDSLAAFNNSMPSEHGDTVNLTGLTVLGDSAKFVLSGNATLTGPLTFTMPALGFTNDLASVSNGQGSANTKFGPAVTNLDIAFAGVAPVAIMKDLDLSAATLAVDATAVATAVGRYPLVRANGTLTALSATPTVTGVTGAYVGLVEASADGKGYDLIIANTVAKPTADTPLYYTGDEQAGVADGTGYTVTDGTKTQPGDYTATVSLAADYRWAETPTDTNDLKLAWTILAQYKVTCDGLEVVVNKSWTDAALGVEAKQSPVQEKLNAYNNTHNLIKYWEVYAVGFAAEKASEAAPVVQPVQTTDATKLRLNLGADWPATSAQPTDSGVKVKYELHNAQTVGAEHHAIQENAAPQFDIPLSGWTSNVQYYRIRLVFEKKVVSEKL